MPSNIAKACDVRVTWHTTTTPTVAQQQAWMALWRILLAVPPPQANLPALYAGEDGASLVQDEVRHERGCDDQMQ